MTTLSQDIMVLQSWFSPAFPIGAFSYSHGLETAIQQGRVADNASLAAWIDCLLRYGGGWNDALFIKLVYEEGSVINTLCLALSSSSEREQETTELGRSFVRTLNASYGFELPDGLAYPVAVGLAARQEGISLALVIQSYLQAFAANLISVGVRVIPIGQQAGQACLVQLYPVIERMTKKVLNSNEDALGSAAFTSDLMAMMHENNSPRIYRT
jgi:urease accessory protein